jgi:hypothetical protein
MPAGGASVGDLAKDAVAGTALRSPARKTAQPVLHRHSNNLALPLRPLPRRTRATRFPPPAVKSVHSNLGSPTALARMLRARTRPIVAA